MSTNCNSIEIIRRIMRHRKIHCENDGESKPINLIRYDNYEEKIASKNMILMKNDDDDNDSSDECVRASVCVRARVCAYECGLHLCLYSMI